MTKAQVFRWFCKEQGLMPFMRKLYYETRPFDTKYDKENGILTKYLSFDEYIENKMNGFGGFQSALGYIIANYFAVNRIKKVYAEFHDLNVSIEEKMKPIYKKWNYFVKNNVFLLNNKIKIGDKVKFINWGTVDEIEVRDINIHENKIIGRVERFNLDEYIVPFRNLLNEDGTPMEFDYMIKRNRRTYNGQNRK